MSDPALDPRFAQPGILFFGIGAQKSGTSWLHDFLNAHDEVCVPRGKELHYWTHLGRTADARIGKLAGSVQAARKQARQTARDAKAAAPAMAGDAGDEDDLGDDLEDDLGGAGTAETGADAGGAAAKGAGAARRIQLRMLRHRDASHKSYADVLFRRYSGQKVVGEITPDYAQLTTRDFRQMAALNPDTRFVFLMRDPIDRLHSAMRKRLRGRVGGDRKQKVAGVDILSELKTLLERRAPAALLRSQYETTITALERAVPHEKIGLFFYEDIFGNRNGDAICDFLSVARRPGDFDAVANVGNPFSEAGAEEFTALSMQRLKPTYDFMAARFGDRLPERWRQRQNA